MDSLPTTGPRSCRCSCVYLVLLILSLLTANVCVARVEAGSRTSAPAGAQHVKHRSLFGRIERRCCPSDSLILSPPLSGGHRVSTSNTSRNQLDQADDDWSSEVNLIAPRDENNGHGGHGRPNEASSSSSDQASSSSSQGSGSSVDSHDSAANRITPALTGRSDIRFAFLIPDQHGHIRRYVARFIRMPLTYAACETFSSMVQVLSQQVELYSDNNAHSIRGTQYRAGENGWRWRLQTAGTARVPLALLRDILFTILGDPRFAAYAEFMVNVYDETHLSGWDYIYNGAEGAALPLVEPGIFVAFLAIDQDPHVLLEPPQPDPPPPFPTTTSDDGPGTPTQNRLPAAAQTPPSVNAQRAQRMRQRPVFSGPRLFLDFHGFAGRMGGSDGEL